MFCRGKILADKNYKFNVQVNWSNLNEFDYLESIKENKKSKRIIANKNPFNLPNRLWLYLLKKIDIDNNISWNKLDKSGNKLLNVLFNDSYQVNGKTTFKKNL